MRRGSMTAIHSPHRRTPGKMPRHTPIIAVYIQSIPRVLVCISHHSGLQHISHWIFRPQSLVPCRFRPWPCSNTLFVGLLPAPLPRCLPLRRLPHCPLLSATLRLVKPVCLLNRLEKSLSLPCPLMLLSTLTVMHAGRTLLPAGKTMKCPRSTLSSSLPLRLMCPRS